MNDLIDRQAALDAMENCEPGEEPFVIKNLPSVDAVEVVRCKDCKHRDPEDKKCDFGHDIIWQLPRRDDWYCADGERKDGRGGMMEKMTNVEAIETLRANYPDACFEQLREAVDKAIKALEAQEQERK